MEIKIKKVYAFQNIRIYHAICPHITYIFSVEMVKDNIGTLYRAESSITGFFEAYGFDKVTSIIKEKIKALRLP